MTPDVVVMFVVLVYIYIRIRRLRIVPSPRKTSTRLSYALSLMPRSSALRIRRRDPCARVAVAGASLPPSVTISENKRIDTTARGGFTNWVGFGGLLT
jgi:hypothetical protein